MLVARIVLEALRPPSSSPRYGPRPSQQAELHLPRGEGPHPVAVLVHGGHWRARHGRRVMRPLARDLTRRGWAAWNLEYRRVGRGQGGGWPATLEDVAAAVDALAEVDAALDLRRVAAIGHSAGGQLALWAASRPGLAAGTPGAAPRVRIDRAVAQAGVLELEETARADPRSSVRDFLGGGPDEVPGRYAVADPAKRVPLGVPTLLVHGDRDQTVSPRQSRSYAAAARAAGDEVELVEVPHAGHRDHLDPSGAAWRAVVDWLGARQAPAAGS